MTKKLKAGLGQAVAERTILRKKENGQWETWGDVAKRVAIGNTSVIPCNREETARLESHISNATILMSGRHLQHGDASQADKTMEVFTNCSTAASSSLSFYLALNGSGVGRAYYDDLLVIPWDKAPDICLTLSANHADNNQTTHINAAETLVVLKANGIRHKFHIVEDSREGWFKSLELWENMTYSGDDRTLVLDFSAVRPKGSPINGMQGRPASGPVPLMEAFQKSQAAIRQGHSPWLTEMLIDHLFAECVLVGGVRRSARIALKYWKDPDALAFVKSKNDHQMWTANNSLAVDQEFWDKLAAKDPVVSKLFRVTTETTYESGEPGFVNIHKLSQKGTVTRIAPTIGSHKLLLTDTSQQMLTSVWSKAASLDYHQIVNPCGEISLALWGAYCVIGDLAPSHAVDLMEVLESAAVLARALVRINCMPSIYSDEVKRTNRIGVGLTGVHEFAWKFWKLGFRDLLDEQKSRDFWMFLESLSQVATKAAQDYSKELGLEEPHTTVTVKPAGTTSKLFGLTEGWHLPKAPTYLRWVQFNQQDPLLAQHTQNNYPVKDLGEGRGTSIVGFPTRMALAGSGIGEKLVTASELTIEESFQWVRLGEKYWLGGTHGNQISFTAKFDQSKISLEAFQDSVKEWQPRVKCISMLPDTSYEELERIYGYAPEQPMTEIELKKIEDRIKGELVEDVDRVHVDCEGGACPINFTK